MSARRLTLLTTAATAAATLIAPVAASAAPATKPACDKAAWESTVQGRPAGFGAGSPTGDYLGHNRTGFHLRVTHAEHDRRVYSGWISASARMHLQRVRLEKGDRVVLSHDRRTIVFAFANHGAVDGVNFTTACASTLTVSRLHVGRHRLAPAHVYLGSTKQHPAAVPFTLHRTPTPAT